MEIIVAKTAGFCFGVKRAVDMAYAEAAKKKEGNAGIHRIYTYGPIIHNEDVVRDLEEKGIEALEENQLHRLQPGDTLIIRSHGAPKKIYELAENAGAVIVDATCPFVSKIHEIVRTSDRQVVVIGDRNHPEVQGICGWAPEGTEVVKNIEEFQNLGILNKKKLTFVAQTTFNHIKFKEIIDKIDSLGYDVICFNTVCNATQERQKEAAGIASRVDAMVVIGSRLSSNTQKLYEICRENCKVTWFVGNSSELQRDYFNSVDSVGITAGASTPKHIIEEVQTYVRS